jgi:hypothetical protein
MRIHSSVAAAPRRTETLKTRIEAAFTSAQRKQLKALVTDMASIPAKLKVPKAVSAAYKKQLPGVEDGSLSLYKLPFGKSNFVYVVSFRGGDGGNEDVFFSKSGKKIDDHSFSFD